MKEIWFFHEKQINDMLLNLGLLIKPYEYFLIRVSHLCYNMMI